MGKWIEKYIVFLLKNFYSQKKWKQKNKKPRKGVRL